MWQLAEKVLRKSKVFRIDSLRSNGRSEETGLRTSPFVTTYNGDANDVLQCSIAYNRYGGYCVPLASQHRPVPQTILEGEVWEPLTVDFLVSQCGTGDVIHAGTYFGDFFPPLSRAIAPTAKIWSFEPHPENYRCARITMAINGLRNIELRNAGLGERAGSFVMNMIDRESGMALGGASRINRELRDASDVGQTRVEVVSIDDVVPSDRPISIIQLDVEGFEQYALTGALKTIRRCRPAIIVEKKPDEAWLAENLYPLGYQKAGRLHDNTLYATREYPEAIFG